MVELKENKFFLKSYTNIEMLVIMFNLLDWNIIMELSFNENLNIKAIKKLLYEVSNYIMVDLNIKIFFWYILKQDKERKIIFILKERLNSFFNSLIKDKIKELVFSIFFDIKYFLNIFIGKENIVNYKNEFLNCKGIIEFIDYSNELKKQEIYLRMGKNLNLNLMEINAEFYKFIDFIVLKKESIKVVLEISRIEELDLDFIKKFIRKLKVVNYFWCYNHLNYHTKTHSRNDSSDKYIYMFFLDKHVCVEDVEKIWWDLHESMQIDLKEMVKRYKKYMLVENYIKRFKDININVVENFTCYEFYYYLKDKFKNKERLHGFSKKFKQEFTLFNRNKKK